MSKVESVEVRPGVAGFRIQTKVKRLPFVFQLVFPQRSGTSVEWTLHVPKPTTVGEITGTEIQTRPFTHHNGELSHLTLRLGFDSLLLITGMGSHVDILPSDSPYRSSEEAAKRFFIENTLAFADMYGLRTGIYTAPGIQVRAYSDKITRRQLEEDGFKPEGRMLMRNPQFPKGTEAIMEVPRQYWPSLSIPSPSS